MNLRASQKLTIYILFCNLTDFFFLVGMHPLEGLRLAHPVLLADGVIVGEHGDEPRSFL